MKLLAFLFFLCVVQFANAQVEIAQPIRFLALGDSYTIGQSVPVDKRWPRQLMDTLEAKGYEVDTLHYIATTGWRTDNLINAISGKNLEDKNFNLVSLLIGVNNQYQGRPFMQYQNEFPALLDSAIRYAGGIRERVFVVSIPDYAYTPFGQGDPDISEELDQYNAYNQQIAEEEGVTWFNITPISRQGLVEPVLVANDGLHPSGEQYRRWVDLMAESFQTTTSTGSVIENRVTVYPNPFDSVLMMDYPPELEGEKFELFDVSGNRVYRGKFSFQHRNIATDSWSSGMYSIIYEIEERVVVERVVRR